MIKFSNSNLWSDRMDKTRASCLLHTRDLRSYKDTEKLKVSLEKDTLHKPKTKEIRGSNTYIK